MHTKGGQRIKRKKSNNQRLKARIEDGNKGHGSKILKWVGRGSDFEGFLNNVLNEENELLP